jgi:aminodeoxyfutalosine deaminase
MTGRVEPHAYRARLVVPVSAPPLRDGVVTIAGERIVAVGVNQSDNPPLDLGDVALLPGLVNAHTHLEFSLLEHPLGRRGMPLPDWIAALVRHRRGAEQNAGDDGHRQRQAVLAAGLHECLTHGVTTVGDIVTTELDDLSWYRLPLRWYAFRELLGQSTERVAQQAESARRHVQQVTGTNGVWPALSPHAPYSTSRELVELACRLSRQGSGPVALHLAESPEELQWLATGGGPMRDMLEALGGWQATMGRGGAAPRDYLELLATAARSLVVHGNYLGVADWEFLAERAEHMAVVYCPRTHDYFEHQPYPLSQMMRRGVRVVAGTDSRASNPDVSVWEELRVIAQQHPWMAASDILRMATLDAAAALGCDHEVGSLAIGKLADITLIRIDPRLPANAPDALWEFDDAVTATMSRGRIVHQRRHR